eukprot:3931860-Pyramimonas_sp.AAC.1
MQRIRGSPKRLPPRCFDSAGDQLEQRVEDDLCHGKSGGVPALLLHGSVTRQHHLSSRRRNASTTQGCKPLCQTMVPCGEVRHAARQANCANHATAEVHGQGNAITRRALEQQRIDEEGCVHADVVVKRHVGFAVGQAASDSDACLSCGAELLVIHRQVRVGEVTLALERCVAGGPHRCHQMVIWNASVNHVLAQHSFPSAYPFPVESATDHEVQHPDQVEADAPRLCQSAVVTFQIHRAVSRILKNQRPAWRVKQIISPVRSVRCNVHYVKPRYVAIRSSHAVQSFGEALSRPETPITSFGTYLDRIAHHAELPPPLQVNCLTCPQVLENVACRRMAENNPVTFWFERHPKDDAARVCVLRIHLLDGLRQNGYGILPIILVLP